MRITSWLGLVLAASAVSATQAAGVVTLYDGSAAPDAQGWARFTTGATVASAAGLTTFTTGTDGAFTSQFNSYAYATGATNYIVSIRMQVLSAQYNMLDGGLVFSAFGKPGFVQQDRTNTVMFDNNSVVWGDLTGGTATVGTGAFHEYALRYLNGNLDLFVDASYADIRSGAASAVLSRAGVTLTGSTSVGTVVFGDGTNDLGFDSNYIVDYVNFQDLDAPASAPEPGSLALVAAALAAVHAGRRARRR